ncbi:P-loop containing nucleoside triphosphate hydrolase protein [Desarmillaria ectypa]|nr:P-loop containing nucleoside triphosphate hydrolase protein [Desarmillaria ectypa]
MLLQFLRHQVGVQRAWAIPWQHRRLSTAVTLRPYQQQCIDECVGALATGALRIGVSLPTGSGKTTVFISLLSRLPQINGHGKKALIIVNSIELARQSAEQVVRLFPHWSVEIEQGAKHVASGRADITIATYQTLIQPERIKKFKPAVLKGIIIDEAHHAAAPSYRRILSHFDAGIPHPEALPTAADPDHKIPIIGFSATFSRHDGLKLGVVFDKIVYHKDFLTMIKDQWLCPVRFTTTKADMNLDDVTVNSRNGDFNATSLAHVVNTETINTLVVQTWLEKAAIRKSTLVFCVNVAHVHSLTQAFRQFGIDARYLYAKTPAPERKALIAAFKAGNFPVLINCAILTEGADIPNIDCVMVVRPTRSRNLFAQMIGRGMRLSPETGKEDCRIIDFVDSNTRISGVISTPSLFGLDPDEIDINDESLESMERRVNDANTSYGYAAENVPKPETVTYVDYNDPLSFLKLPSDSPNVRNLSNNAWIAIGKEKFILECLGKGYIKIELVKEDDAEPYWKAMFTPAGLDKTTAYQLKISPFMRARNVCKSSSLDEAIKACDTYAKAKAVRGPMAKGLLRSAQWRKTPATDSQKVIVAKRYKLPAEEIDSNADNLVALRISKMTKGEAADTITRLKHGALALHTKRMKEAKKAQKNYDKEVQRRLRETVIVGQLSGSPLAS